MAKVKKREELRKSSNIITLGNIIFGILVIFYSIKQSFWMAAIFLLIAVVLDFLDGKIARLTKTSSSFGVQLDSLADIVSFGIAPAVFGYMNISTWPAIIAYIVFICCGVIRLAMFNIQETKGYYKGMPITMNGLVIPIIYMLGIPVLVWPIFYFVLGILMVSPFKIYKP